MLSWSHNTRSDKHESKLDILRCFQSQLKNLQENVLSYIVYATEVRNRILYYSIPEMAYPQDLTKPISFLIDANQLNCTNTTNTCDKPQPYHISENTRSDFEILIIAKALNVFGTKNHDCLSQKVASSFQCQIVSLAGFHIASKAGCFAGYKDESTIRCA